MRVSMMWRSLRIDEDFRWITASEICIILHIIWKPLLILGWRNVQMFDYHCRADAVMRESIPAAPSAPPPPFSRAEPRALAFFCLGWQIPGGGDSWAVKSPGVGTKKEGKCPVLRQHCNIFVDRTVEEYHFKLFNVRFFVSINVFLCNSASLIKTSRRDETSLWF